LAGRLTAAFQQFHKRKRIPAADWAAWHLRGGPVGPPAWWAATSNVAVGCGTVERTRDLIARKGIHNRRFVPFLMPCPVSVSISRFLRYI